MKMILAGMAAINMLRIVFKNSINIFAKKEKVKTIINKNVVIIKEPSAFRLR